MVQQQVEECERDRLVRLRWGGRPIVAIAKMFDVSDATVSRVTRRRTWKHVEAPIPDMSAAANPQWAEVA